jgi:hypothetical protein
MITTGSSSDDWILLALWFTTARNYTYIHGALSLVHTRYSPPLHTHWDSVSTSRLLATGLNTVTTSTYCTASLRVFLWLHNSLIAPTCTALIHYSTFLSLPITQADFFRCYFLATIPRTLNCTPNTNTSLTLLISDTGLSLLTH